MRVVCNTLVPTQLLRRYVTYTELRYLTNIIKLFLLFFLFSSLAKHNILRLKKRVKGIVVIYRSKAIYKNKKKSSNFFKGQPYY